MSEPEPQPAVPPPQRPWFQFSLRTLLLLFVVLGASLAVFGAWGIVVVALTVGLAVYVHHAHSLSSVTPLMLVVLCLMCVFGWLLPVHNGVRESARRSVCADNLHQIALALQSYHQANGCFPPAYIADKDGKPMHSWRVLILPYLGHDDIYKAYDFSQPWDAPKNKRISDMLLMASMWRWPMAVCNACGPLVVRARTCGRSCKSAPTRKRKSALMQILTARNGT